MRQSFRSRSGALVLAAAATLTATSLSAQPGPAAPPAPPRLVVLVAVDQLLPAYLDRYAEQLTGGLGRMLRGGAVFTRAYQDHAVTETAPGHAAMLSGRFPRSTGIVANTLGVADVQAPLIGGGGPGASPYRFRGTVLYDWMRLRHPSARALSVSRKDRGAILPMGRAARDVYWYASDGRMTTSVWYRDTLPGWVQRFNARRIPQSYAGRAWTPLLADTAYAEPDSNVLESSGRDFTFPHVMHADSVQAAGAFPNFPWMDDMLVAFALDGVVELGLGARDTTDLLALSLSTTDAVGHRYGPDSREIHDQVLRVDRALGAFLDSLYRLRDSASIAVVLTSDHGVGSYPAMYARRHPLPVTHAVVGPTVEANARALAARGIPASAMSWDDGMVVVDREALRRGGVNPDSAIRDFAQAIRKVPGILRVDETRTLAKRDTVRDHIARRWLHMIPAEWDVPVVATLVPGALWGGGTMATHGTPHDYDAHVPMIFYGPWFATGRIAQFSRVVDIAPTLARIVGVPPAEALDGRVLTRALAPGRR